jgi:crossover junction endodeoxyribonuclease RuvC
LDSKATKNSKTDRIVLGIDPGTGRCGWAILKKEGPRLLDCGLIETPAKTPLADRLEIIFEKIAELILQYQPTEMAIEELFFVKNIKTGISVAHARGAIMLAAKQAKVPIYEYKPNEIKLAIAGFGHADKGQMARMVKMHLKNSGPTRGDLKESVKWDSVKQDDTVDAAAIALTHLQISRIK